MSPDDARLYVASFRNDLVAIVDTTIHRVVARVPVGSGPYGVAVHPDGGRVYVSNFDAATVSVIDTATHRVEATVPVAQWPRGVAISPDGAQVYVPNRGANSLQVIDTGTNAVIASVAVGEGLTASPSGHRTSPRLLNRAPSTAAVWIKIPGAWGAPQVPELAVESAAPVAAVGAAARVLRAPRAGAPSRLGLWLSLRLGLGLRALWRWRLRLGLWLWPRRCRGLCGRLRLDAHTGV